MFFKLLNLDNIPDLQTFISFISIRQDYFTKCKTFVSYKAI